jgi:3'-phosphoadenosine 5'-phosphosulfate sulfotransferase (PAPS reductase)/FAD synthetase
MNIIYTALYRRTKGKQNTNYTFGCMHCTFPASAELFLLIDHIQTNVEEN